MKKIRKYYPKCDSPVSKSTTKGYMFQCHQCDEDFYNFEVQAQPGKTCSNNSMEYISGKVRSNN